MPEGDTSVQMKPENYISIKTTFEKLHKGAKATLSIPDSEFKIRLACSPGEFVMPDKSDAKKLSQEFKESVAEMNLSHDLQYLVDLYEHNLYLTAFYIQGVNLASPEAKCGTYLHLALYLHDNLIDGDINSENTYTDLSIMNKLIMNVLTDRPSNDERCINVEKRMDVIKMFKKFHDLSCDTFQNYSQINSTIIREIDEHLQAQAWLVLDKDCFTDTLLFRRERTSAVHLSVEYGRLIRGIPLSEASEKSIIRHRFDSCAAYAVMLVNDLLSWEREKSETDGQNYFHARIKEGLTIPIITAEIIEMINSNVAELVWLGTLIEQVSTDPHIRRYTQYVRQVVDGNLFFHLTTPRYVFASGLDNQKLKCLHYSSFGYDFEIESGI